MLFRRSTYYSFILLAIVHLVHAKDDLDIYLKAGKTLGKSVQRLELSERELEAITPLELHGKQFDGEKARSEIMSTPYQKGENTLKNDMDPALMAILENADNALQGQPHSFTIDHKAQESIEKCIYEIVHSPVVLHHRLTVNVSRKPGERKKVKICNGHYREEKSRDPKKDKSKQKRKFAADPTIKSSSVSIDEQGFGHRDLVMSRWVHIDDAASCDSFHEVEQEIASAQWLEEDVWKMEKPELLSSLDCTLVNTENGPPETHTIEGCKVFRPSWFKSHHMRCMYRHQINCGFLKEKVCVLTSEKCITKFEEQCTKWEKFFRCNSKHRPQIGGEVKSIYGTDKNLWETRYEPSTALSDVTTKLAVFDEMKRELQNAQIQDARSVHIFKGNDQQCTKSIAEDIMYDCCSSMDGFATKIKLSKCTADEIALAESKKKGLCHYVGKKKEKFLGLWVSRTEHVFCTFQSKLSRVFQEEARKQLNIDWGDTEKPDCRGLTQEEIKKLDFSKLNLVEAFELPKNSNNDEKIKRIEERLKQRIKDI